MDFIAEFLYVHKDDYISRVACGIVQHQDMIEQCRILIVDDSRHFLSILRAILRGFGFKEVVQANDGFEALESLRTVAYDLVLLDLEMGVLDGIDLVRMVRQSVDSPNRNVPIIMVSAYSERWRVDNSKQVGANSFIVKPVSPQVLRLRIKNLLPYLEI